MPVLIGTSGWQYRHWKEKFYLNDVPASRWLEHYAQRFASVELNSSFYRLPKMSTFTSWASTVPDDFVFAVKASRYLTHVRRLREPEEPVQRLLQHAAGLGSKLGPILLQLPPNLTVDVPALRGTLAAFPKDTRVAVELRHPSWFCSETRELLERAGAPLCITDTDGKGPPRWRTAEWGYVRFHHGRGKPGSCYGRMALRTWAERLAGIWDDSSEVYTYFNNDGHGCAVRDAHRFASAVKGAGLTPTRVPSAREAPV